MTSSSLPLRRNSFCIDSSVLFPSLRPRSCNSTFCRSFGASLKVLDILVSHQHRLQGCVVIKKLYCSRLWKWRPMVLMAGAPFGRSHPGTTGECGDARALTDSRYGDATGQNILSKSLGLLEQQLSGLNLGAGLLRKTWRECFVL